MEKKSEIKLFEERKVRTIWNAETENWYFVISDVVQILTDTKDPGDYIKKMRKRDQEFAKGWGQIVTPLSVETPGGKQRTNLRECRGVTAYHSINSVAEG